MYTKVFLVSSTAHLDLAPLAPLIVIGLTLLIYCLDDLIQRESVTGGNKLAWAAIIILLSMLCEIIYLALGRRALPITFRSVIAYSTITFLTAKRSLPG